MCSEGNVGMGGEELRHGLGLVRREIVDDDMDFFVLGLGGDHIGEKSHELRPGVARDERRRLADSMRQFIRMYNPHEAREDTVLFPAFRNLVSKNEYDSLGEDFEKKEHELFGENGFEIIVDQVAGIEKTLGIYDLAQFTPRIESERG